MTKQRRTVLVSGLFNILHPGHLRLLRFAKECGDHLIVAVESDRLAGTAAHIAEELRLEGLRSNLWVNESFISDEPINQTILRLKPDIVVKGKEHEGAFNPELAALNQIGGKLIFSSGETAFSSLELIRKEIEGIDSRSIELPADYMARHGISLERLKALVERFATLKVCVVGDMIVDEYITCESLGMSHEDPTLVVMPLDTARFIGGAGIVAAHAASLGASVKFVSVTGKDATRDFALETLRVTGVEASLFIDERRPTSLKQRFRSKGKTLLRVSQLHQRSISVELQEQVLAEVGQALIDADLLVFSDFNYGCLPQQLVARITALGKARGLLMLADSQSSSQIGNIARFTDMDLLTPTEREARISTRNHEEGLVVLAEHLSKESAARYILLKLGQEGLLIHAGGERKNRWLTDRIGALNSAPKDVAGAGDSLLITSGLTLACGGDIWEAACLGSLAAAIQVSRVGNTPIRPQEMQRELCQ
jgi:rfaE bifunctional protein kinase chain/domain